MMVTSINTEVQKIPLKKPFITALRRVEHVQSVLVSLSTQSTLVGLGEAPPTVAITGETLESITHTLTQCIAPAICNVRVESFLDLLPLVHHHGGSHNSSAKAAVDMALFDLAAKASNMPLHQFLGGTYQGIPTYITISLNAPEVMARDAKEAFENGFILLKIKVGSNDGKDLERILHVKHAAPNATIIIDANQAWDYEQSIAIIKALKMIDIKAIEQPVKAHDIASLQAVTAFSHIPIIADESVFTLEDAANVIERKAADIINIKLMKCGGISKALEIIALCRVHGIPCMLGSMLEGAKSIEAAMHLAMSHSDVITICDLDSPILYETLPKYSEVSYEKSTLLIPALNA
jgi:o-succinylbenzoate synthase